MPCPLARESLQLGPHLGAPACLSWPLRCPGAHGQPVDLTPVHLAPDWSLSLPLLPLLHVERGSGISTASRPGPGEPFEDTPLQLAQRGSLGKLWPAGMASVCREGVENALCQYQAPSSPAQRSPGSACRGCVISAWSAVGSRARWPEGALLTGLAGLPVPRGRTHQHRSEHTCVQALVFEVTTVPRASDL